MLFMSYCTAAVFEPLYCCCVLLFIAIVLMLFLSLCTAAVFEPLYCCCFQALVKMLFLGPCLLLSVSGPGIASASESYSTLAAVSGPMIPMLVLLGVLNPGLAAYCFQDSSTVLLHYLGPLPRFCFLSDTLILTLPLDTLIFCIFAENSFQRQIPDLILNSNWPACQS